MSISESHADQGTSSVTSAFRVVSNSWIDSDGHVTLDEGPAPRTTFHFVDTLIISDIHLGSPVSRSKHLLSLLKQYSFNRLILNGDVFDDLNFKNFTDSDWELLGYLRTISEPSSNKEIVWVVGNHDGMAKLLTQLLGIRIHEEYVWKYNNKIYMAIHGHQFDTFIENNVVITAIATWLYLFLQKIDFKQQRFSRWVKRSSKAWLTISEKIAKDAIEYAKRFGADVVICGHTHVALQRIENGVEYFNSGCWTDLPSHFITIDGFHGVKINEIH